ncbi:hypothetical protein D1872_81790 [compost metagenome]
MEKVIVATKLSTKNDKNGNPRRLYIVTAIDPQNLHHGGERLDIIEEGYEGLAALRNKYPSALLTQEIEVAPSEYKRWKQVKKADDKNREEAAKEAAKSKEEMFETIRESVTPEKRLEGLKAAAAAEKMTDEELLNELGVAVEEGLLKPEDL